MTDSIAEDPSPTTASGHDKRRARTERSVLDATRAVLGEAGFAGLTVEGVAARAGVAKTTIYRRHRSKTDLALALLLEMVGEVSTRPYTKDTAAELVALVDKTVELMQTTVMGLIMKGLVSEVAADPQLAEVYRGQVVTRRQADVTELVERGKARGELREDLDPETVTDLLLGPIYYRFFLSGSPMDGTFGRRLIAALLPSLAPAGQTSNG
ncbi:TetR/AcrR family transcriptional regulator [Sinomonas sp. P10A9]|uniref:TetR/AcrR family transcriptional regulator n=1 Tax=Sinomonas puerhi TaxID=3238584 RepID=A0AB39L2X9_9MICC